MSFLRSFSTNRFTLRGLYYVWIAMPYPLRKPVTAGVLLAILGYKWLTRVEHQNALTEPRHMGNLSFWGVPDIDLEAYRLQIDGEVTKEATLSYQDILAWESIERPVRMDCVGGFRNNTTMKGITFRSLLESVSPTDSAETAMFHCADGYYTTHLIADLLASEAFLAYQVNQEDVSKFGHPLRLVAPGTYGYKWPKWVVRIELVQGFPPGYWESRGVPKRGRVGDIW
ncbi:MAG: molybdopterin-dependent oxidoreductase [Chloroflexi bacterium]|nr:molybdopterin-dependent oxidoreductase [Chloroflexota bacterium]